MKLISYISLISLAIFSFSVSAFILHHEFNMLACMFLSMSSIFISCKITTKEDNESKEVKAIKVSTYCSNGKLKLNGSYVEEPINHTSARNNTYYFDMSDGSNTTKTFSNSEPKE